VMPGVEPLFEDGWLKLGPVTVLLVEY
jgi:hypothetical protein